MSSRALNTNVEENTLLQGSISKQYPSLNQHNKIRMTKIGQIISQYN
jgi:hypothetical protein